jgi:hypothetical protein
MLPQQLGDISNHIDIQVPCVDLQAIGAVYLGGATCQRERTSAHRRHSLISETPFNISQ